METLSGCVVNVDIISWQIYLGNSLTHFSKIDRFCRKYGEKHSLLIVVSAGTLCTSCNRYCTQSVGHTLDTHTHTHTHTDTILYCICAGVG